MRERGFDPEGGLFAAIHLDLSFTARRATRSEVRTELHIRLRTTGAIRAPYAAFEAALSDLVKSP